MSSQPEDRFPPRPLRKVAGRMLESALNRAVALDPETCQALTDLEGRRLHVYLQGPELTLALYVESGRLRVGPTGTDDDASLRVTTSPGTLLAMAFNRADDSVAPGSVEVAGDAELARRLEKLARGYAPDVEATFADVFGEVVGVPLARGLTRALGHVRDSVSHATEDVADWLREESRLGIAPGEMDAFLDAVDELRERSDRLQARLDRVATQRGSGT